MYKKRDLGAKFFFLILYALVMFLNRVFRKEWFNRFPWFLASLIKNGRTLRKCYIFSRWTNSWSNLTLKCNANTFVKIDARIEGKLPADYISYLQGHSCPSFSCKKLNNQKHTANTVRNIRRTTFTVRRQLSSICVSTFTNV